MIDDRKLLKVLDRVATALEALAHIEAPAKSAAPTRSEAELRARARKSVSVIHRDRFARPEPRWPGGLPPAGGTPPEEHFRRLD